MGTLINRNSNDLKFIMNKGKGKFTIDGYCDVTQDLAVTNDLAVGTDVDVGGLVKSARYKFRDARVVVVHCGPELGGFQIISALSGCTWAITSERVGITNYTGFVDTIRGRRPVDLLMYIPTEGSAQRFKAIGISADWNSGSGSTTIEFKTRVIGTNSVSTLLTSSPSSPSDLGHSIAMNLQTNVYWLEFIAEDLNNGATSNLAKNVLLQIQQNEL